VADLIIHTAGRQERLKRSPIVGRQFQQDFIEVFQIADRDLHEYMSVEGVKKEYL